MTDLPTVNLDTLTTATLVGSREIPDESKAKVYRAILLITKKLLELDIDGISGGAPGMDDKWHQAYIYYQKPEKFYCVLPWNGFEDHYKDDYNITLDDWMDLFAQHILQTCGVVWYDNLTQGMQRLYKRNVYQILLPDYSKTDIVIYYAPYSKAGIPKGGTAIAWRIAEALGIPTFNIAMADQRNALFKLLGIDKNEIYDRKVC